MRSLLVTLITCLFVLPANAKYSGGTGEPNDPYRVGTAADLISLGEDANDYHKHFILIADIDLDPNLPGRKVFDRAVVTPISGAISGDIYEQAFVKTVAGFFSRESPPGIPRECISDFMLAVPVDLLRIRAWITSWASTELVIHHTVHIIIR